MNRMSDKGKTVTRVIILMFFGLTIQSLYGFLNLFYNHNIIMAYVNFLASFFILLDLLYFFKTRNNKIVFLIGLIVCSLQILLLIPFSSGNQLSLIWIIILPLIAFYTQGASRGALFSLTIILLFFLLAFMKEQKLVTIYYLPFVYRDVGLVFLIISFMTYIYEKSLSYRENDLSQQLFRNELTGLPNRKRLLRDLKEINSEGTTVLFLINIDQFREINDILGCEKGDIVLKEIAIRLDNLKSRYQELEIYKLHADEYAVLSIIEESDMENYIHSRVQAIQELLKKRIFLKKTNLVISASIGVTMDKINHLAKADYAMRLARKHHRMYYMFRESMYHSRDYQGNLQLLSHMEKIIKEDGVIPYFQPIIDNSTNQISKYECLMRLKDGDEILTPDLFMKLSKRAKVYGIITRAFISRTFHFIQDKNEDFSINICLEDILDEKTKTHIYKELERYNIGDRLIFEFLETEQIEICPQVSQFISHIRSFGCRTAIDDFGSGYSNFDYILKLKFDYLKIDSSLIKHLDNDRNSLVMVEAIVDFSKKLGLKTIAEHVSSEDIYKIIKRLGIDYSQGYYLWKPSSHLVVSEYLVSPKN